jgi:hypothetical protein
MCKIDRESITLQRPILTSWMRERGWGDFDRKIQQEMTILWSNNELNAHQRRWAVGYNEFDFFLENKEYRPSDGCKVKI